MAEFAHGEEARQQRTVVDIAIDSIDASRNQSCLSDVKIKLQHKSSGDGDDQIGLFKNNLTLQPEGTAWVSVVNLQA